MQMQIDQLLLREKIFPLWCFHLTLSYTFHMMPLDLYVCLTPGPKDTIDKKYLDNAKNKKVLFILRANAYSWAWFIASHEIKHTIKG